jgi:hypothetical protein
MGYDFDESIRLGCAITLGYIVLIAAVIVAISLLVGYLLK